MRELEPFGFVDVAPLGSGGLGDVVRATRTSTGGTVAIKLLRDVSDPDVTRQRIERELRALVDLRGHPNVVNVEEVIDADGVLAIVMEHASGGSVAALADARGGVLAFPETLFVAAGTAAALTAAHARGVIHRDIKPHNLLIGAFGSVKVCDFGIAALTRSEDVANRTNSLSLRYASPEELRGDDIVGPTTDIYSLAATVHHLLTGTHLPTPDGSARSIPIRNWTAPADLPADVEIRFRELMVRCADRDPGVRPSAEEVDDRLEELGGLLGDQRCRALPHVPDHVEAPATPARVTKPRPAPISPPDPDGTIASGAAGSMGEPTAVAAPGGGRPPARSRDRRRLLAPVLLASFVIVVVAAAVLAFGRSAADQDEASPTSSATAGSPSTLPLDQPVVITPTSTPDDPSPAPTTSPTTSTTTTPPSDDGIDVERATETGRFEISADVRASGTSIESVDGLAFDRTTGLIVAAREIAPPEIATDDASRGPAALVAFPAGDPSALTLLGALIDETGEPIGARLDIEGLAALDDGSFVIISEGAGERGSEGAPFLLRVDRFVGFVASFDVPAWLVPSDDGTTGFSGTFGPHGIAVRPGVPQEVVIIMEAPLRQDDPDTIRLTSIDVATGTATGEWSYPVDDTAIVSMTGLGDDALLVLEQTQEGTRQLYLIELGAADAPGGPAPEPIEKVRIETDDTTFGATRWASIAEIGPTADGDVGIMLMTDSMFTGAPTIGVTLTLE